MCLLIAAQLSIVLSYSAAHTVNFNTELPGCLPHALYGYRSTKSYLRPDLELTSVLLLPKSRHSTSCAIRVGEEFFQVHDISQIYGVDLHV